MEDMERYGDYNEIDEAPGKRSNPVLTVLKLLCGAVCVLVIGVIAFRIIMFNTYPSEMKTLYFTPTLEEYYESVGDGMQLATQTTEVKYDDPKEGNFFFDHLIVVPEADHLQVAIRYNTSLIESINAEYGLSIDPNADPADIFEFKLVRTVPGYVAPDGDKAPTPPVESVGTLAVAVGADSLMYRYCKVVFDGVDLGLDEGEDAVAWLRLDITVKGAEGKKTYSLPVYDSNLELEYRSLSSGERPQ